MTLGNSDALTLTINSSAKAAICISEISVTYEEVNTPSYTITAATNNNAYGTVSLDGNVITAVPNTGYRYADPAYTVSSGTATVVQNGDEFTVTPSSDCTVTINFEAIPAYTVTLSDDTENPLTEYSAGDGVDLPGRDDIDDYTLAGWSTTNVTTETAIAPDIIPTGTYHPTANVTLYPVYRHSVENGPSINQSVSIADYASANGWQDAKRYQPLVMDKNVSVEGYLYDEANDFKYFNSDNSWRFYTDGSFDVSCTNGYLNTVTFTFSEGSLIWIHDASDVTSGVAKTVNEAKSTFEATSNTKITAISVKYTPSTYYFSSPVAKLPNSISGIEDEYTIDLANNESSVDISTNASATHGTVQYEVTSSTVAQDDYELNGGELTVVSNGIVTIRAYVDADETYKAAAKVVTVKVIDNPIFGGFEGDVFVNTDYGTPYTLETEGIKGGDISLTSGNTAVATVDGLAVIPVAVGAATITISTAESDIWHTGSKTFTLSVWMPEGKETAAVSFNKVTSNDDITDGDYLIVCENSNVAFDGSRENTSDENKLDAGENTIAVEIADNKIAATAATKAATFTIDATEGTIRSASGYYIGQASDANGLATSGTTTYVNSLSISEGNADIVSSGGAYLRYNSASNQARFRYYKSSTYTGQQAIQLYKLTEANLTTTLNASGYATFCSEYPLDFSDYETSSYSAWQITEVDGTTITFSQITGRVIGGTGILLKGTAGAKVTLTSADSDNDISSTNLLYGTLAPTYAETDEYYGLSGNQFKKVNAGTVPAGKALLPASALGSNPSRQLTFIFEDIQGISEVEYTALSTDDAIYSISGQRVSTPKKGLYIMNGKKVVMK